MKKLIFIFLFTILQLLNLLAQSHTILPFYKEGITHVLDMEAGEFEVVRTDFAVLSKNSRVESIRRIFSKDYGYLIIAYADQGLAKIELSLIKDGKEIDNSKAYEDIKKDFFKETEDLDKIAFIIFKPTESEEYIVNIECNQFEANNQAGRSFILVGHTLDEAPLPDPNIIKVTASSYRSYTKNTKKNRYDWGYKRTVKSDIEIDLNEKELTISNRSFNKVYYLTTIKKGKEKGHTIINAQNEAGKSYIIEVNNEAIDIYTTVKKNKIEGTKYSVK